MKLTKVLVADTDQNKPVQTEKSESGQSQNKFHKGGRRYYPKKRYYKPQGAPGEQQAPPTKVSFQKISLVIPLLNEEESILPLINEIRKAIKPLNKPYEVIFVDDGSTDGSLKIIKDAAKVDNRLKFISFRKNYGKSAALQVGFKAATGDAIITMDADLQDDPDEIPSLVAKLNEGYDVVSGWKKDRKDPFFGKIIPSKIFNFVISILAGVKIHDFNCGLKAYKKKLVKSIEVYGEMHRYIPVLAKWAGFNKIGEKVVEHRPRKYGVTKFGWERFINGFLDLFSIMFVGKFGKRPMHFFGLWGTMAFFSGLSIFIYLTISKFFFDIISSPLIASLFFNKLVLILIYSKKRFFPLRFMVHPQSA
jgi:glycosyltransferase involved in cell wall biosynthesis